MVVVLPAPLGPSRPKHSPRADLEIEPGDRDDVGEALDQTAAADGGRDIDDCRLTVERLDD